MWKSILFVASLALVVSGCSTTSASRPAPRRTVAVPAPAPVTTAGVSVTLNGDQITSVRAYYSNTSSSNARGRGRGRNGGLPPGIARNLARGKPLPPGIAKGYLPSTVIASLPRLPSSLDYIIVAGKLLLVEAATQVVREVLLDLAFDS